MSYLDDNKNIIEFYKIAELIEKGGFKDAFEAVKLASPEVLLETDRYGETLLHLLALELPSCDAYAIKLCKFLIDRLPLNLLRNRIRYGETILHYLGEIGDIGICKSLVLKLLPIINETCGLSYTPLFNAICCGSRDDLKVELCELLINNMSLSGINEIPTIGYPETALDLVNRKIKMYSDIKTLLIKAGAKTND